MKDINLTPSLINLNDDDDDDDKSVKLLFKL